MLSVTECCFESRMLGLPDFAKQRWDVVIEQTLQAFLSCLLCMASEPVVHSEF